MGGRRLQPVLAVGRRRVQTLLHLVAVLVVVSGVVLDRQMGVQGLVLGGELGVPGVVLGRQMGLSGLVLDRPMGVPRLDVGVLSLLHRRERRTDVPAD